MAQKPVLRGEVRCACVAREVSVEADWNKGDTSSSAQSSSLSTLPGGAVWALSVAPRDSLTAAAEKCVEECMLNRDGTIRGGSGGGAAITIAAAPLFLGLAPFGVTHRGQSTQGLVSRSIRSISSFSYGYPAYFGVRTGESAGKSPEKSVWVCCCFR